LNQRAPSRSANCDAAKAPSDNPGKESLPCPVMRVHRKEGEKRDIRLTIPSTSELSIQITNAFREPYWVSFDPGC
jgi:hypothetical protein